MPVGTAYVTISVGNGEICSKHINTVEKLENRVSLIDNGLARALEVLRNRNPQARVFVMSVPNWHEL